MFGTALSPAPVGAESSDTLVVFTQPGGLSEIAERFVATSKPALAELAASLGVAFKVVDVTDAGAPAEVGLTPLIVFQNHRGRSIYQGRTETPERVRNLVRTARFRPQQDAVLERPGVPFEKRGRMTLATPIKVTPLAGTPPAGFDADAFADTATGWIRDAAAARGATVDTPARLGRSDRQFYLGLSSPPRGRRHVVAGARGVFAVPLSRSRVCADRRAAFGAVGGPRGAVCPGLRSADGPGR